MTTSTEKLISVPSPSAVKRYFQHSPDKKTIVVKLTDLNITVAFNSIEFFDLCKKQFISFLAESDHADGTETEIFFYHMHSLEQFKNELTKAMFNLVESEARRDWMTEIEGLLIFYQTPDLLSYWDREESRIYSFYGRLDVDHAVDSKVSQGIRYTNAMSLTYYQMVTDHLFLLMAELTGAICFHGAMVEIDGKIVLLAGRSGAGKSTAALALLRSGATLFTDEIVFLSGSENGLVAEGLPIAPSLRGERAFTLPELEESLGIEAPQKMYVDFSDISHKVGRLEKRKIDIVIYFEPPKGKRIQAHRIAELEQMKMFEYLNFQLLGYNFPQYSGKRLQYLLDLVTSVKTYRFTSGRSLDSLYPFLQENI